VRYGSDSNISNFIKRWRGKNHGTGKYSGHPGSMGIQGTLVDWDLGGPGLKIFFKDYLIDFAIFQAEAGVIDILNNATDNSIQETTQG